MEIVQKSTKSPDSAVVGSYNISLPSVTPHSTCGEVLGFDRPWGSSRTEAGSLMLPFTIL